MNIIKTIIKRKLIKILVNNLKNNKEVDKTMENMIKGLGNKKFLVKIYKLESDIIIDYYDEKECTYFELATFILTQEFYKIEIKNVD